jgi:hypothetical protein
MWRSYTAGRAVLRSPEVTEDECPRKGEFAGTGDVVRSPEQKSPYDRVWPVGEWQTASQRVSRNRYATVRDL